MPAYKLLTGLNFVPILAFVLAACTPTLPVTPAATSAAVNTSVASLPTATALPNETFVPTVQTTPTPAAEPKPEPTQTPQPTPAEPTAQTLETAEPRETPTSATETPEATDSRANLIEVAYQKPAKASAFWKNPDLSFPPDGAVDGETDEVGPCVNGGHDTQYWLLPDYTKGWVQIDLLEVFEVVELEWLNVYNGRCGGDRATTKFRIALSETGRFRGEQVIVYSGTMEYEVEPSFQAFRLEQPVRARYVRFYVDDFYGYGGGLNEIRVYALPKR